MAFIVQTECIHIIYILLAQFLDLFSLVKKILDMLCHDLYNNSKSTKTPRTMNEALMHAESVIKTLRYTCEGIAVPCICHSKQTRLEIMLQQHREFLHYSASIKNNHRFACNTASLIVRGENYHHEMMSTHNMHKASANKNAISVFAF